MQLKVQKKLAAKVLKVGPSRVIFDETRLEEIKEAITSGDIKRLITDHAIKGRPVKGISKVRSNKNKRQKRKNLRKGEGSRKGTHHARADTKREWINKVRSQ